MVSKLIQVNYQEKPWLLSRRDSMSDCGYIYARISLKNKCTMWSDFDAVLDQSLLFSFKLLLPTKDVLIISSTYLLLQATTQKNWKIPHREDGSLLLSK